MKVKEIIQRSTPMIKMRINTRSHYKQITFHKYKIARHDQWADGCNYNKIYMRKGDLMFKNYFDDPSDGVIISPFNIDIKLREPACHWKEPLQRGNKKYIKLLQTEVDKIFAKEALKASLIIDGKSFDETPARYMLTTLIFGDQFCKRYNVTPLMKYELVHDEDERSRISNGDTLSMRNIVEFLSKHPKLELFTRMDDDGLELMSIDEENEHNHHATLQTSIDTPEKYELFARFGVLSKPAPYPMEYD